MATREEEVYYDPDLIEAWRKVPRISLVNKSDLDKVRAAGAPTFKQTTGAKGFQPKGHPDIEAEQIKEGNVSGWLFRLKKPSGNEGAGLMWLHGGVHFMGTPLIHEALCNQMVLRTGFTVFAPQCRWAPEYKAPEILESAVEAFAWFSKREGATAGKQAIGGSTGGGSLALSLALWTRDNPGSAPIAAVCCDVPWVSADQGHSLSPEYYNPIDPIWSKETAKFAAECYCPAGTPDPHKYAWPYEHPSYKNFPPVHFNVGHHDIARDAAAELALRIIRESAEGAELHIRRGTHHGSASTAPNARVTLQAHESAARFLLKTLGYQTPNSAAALERL